MPYKIRFSGALKQGAERKAVIGRIAALVGWEEKAVAEKLFTGEALVIKRLDDYYEARRWQSLFGEAGAQVEIVAEPVVAGGPSRPAGKRGRSPSGPPPGRKRKIPRLPLLLAVALLVGVAAGGYFWAKKKFLDTPVPAEIAQVENALATSDMVFLAHANVGQIINLQDSFFKVEEADRFLDNNAAGLVGDLSRAGIDVRKSLQHVVAAGYFDRDSRRARAAAVILGDIPGRKVLDFIRRTYQVPEDQPDSGNALRFRRQDPKTCAYGPLLTAVVSEGRIVLGHADHVDDLLDRLEIGMPAQVDLFAWQQYRDGKVASAALFELDETGVMGKGAGAMVLAAARQKIGPVDSLFAGCSVEGLPPGLSVGLRLNSREGEWIRSAAEKWSLALAARQGKAAENNSAAARLFDSFSVAPAENSIDLGLQVDRKLAANMERAFQDLVDDFMPGSGGGFSSMGADGSSDMIDEDPTKYVAAFSLSRLSDFSDYVSFGESWDWTGGPFGLQVQRASLTPDGLTEISLQAEGRDLKNLGNYGDQAVLVVESAEGDGGEELLRRETCGQDRNSDGAPFGNFMRGSTYRDNQFVHYLQGGVEKSLRLKEGAALDDLRRLKGRIVLNQPTRLEKIILPVPLDGERIERGDVTVKFKPSDGSGISFLLSGNGSRLIAVRAMNRDRKYLQRAGSSSMDMFIGSGVSHSLAFSGKVAFVEVILAAEVQKKEFPFGIASFFRGDENTFPQPERPVEIMSLQELGRRYAAAPPLGFDSDSSWYGKPEAELHRGPVNLALFRLDTSRFLGTTATVMVRTPAIGPLEENLSAVEIAIEGITTGGGAAVPAGMHYFVTLKRNEDSPAAGRKEAILEGQTRITMEHKEEGDPIAAIEGRVNLHLPSGSSLLELTDLKLGGAAVGGGGGVRLVERGKDYFRLELTEGREKIISLAVRNDEGRIISGFPPDISREDGAWLARVGFTGIPGKIEALYADGAEVRSSPFKFSFRR